MKLVNQGVGTLTDAELISIVIREGSNGMSAAGLAEKVLADAGGSLVRLAGSDLKTLRMTEGFGMKRAALLSAAFELCRRLNLEQAHTPSTVTGNEDVVKIFRPMLAQLPYEEFWVLYLSTGNTILDKAKVSQGGVSGTVVDHRLIVKRAVELLASRIILVHNHPSGLARPSPDDMTLTEKISGAALLFDITVLDHLIITPGECFSFRQAGLVGRKD